MSSLPLLSGGPNEGNVNVKQQKIKIIFSDDVIMPIILDITNIPTENITTKWLRRNIRSLRSNACDHKSLKFLKNGGMVSPNSLQNQLKSFRQSINNNHNNSENSNSDSITDHNNENNETFFIHCIVGVDTLADEEMNEHDIKDDLLNQENNLESNEMGAIGFDRLRGLGFTDDEIDVLRAQFRATYGDIYENNNGGGNNNGEDDEGDGTNNTNRIGNGSNPTDIRELEEQWMENDANDERFNSIPIGNLKHNKDLLIGISIGFCFGVFSLILLKFDGLFNRRQSMAIFAGVIINVIFRFVRGF